MSDVMEMRAVPGAVWAQGVDVRAEFIRKTYITLFGAILAFMVIEVAIFAGGAAESIASTLVTLPGGWLTVLGGFMVVGWFASRAAHTAKSRGGQYATLGAFVAADSRWVHCSAC